MHQENGHQSRTAPHVVRRDLDPLARSTWQTVRCGGSNKSCWEVDEDRGLTWREPRSTSSKNKRSINHSPESLPSRQPRGRWREQADLLSCLEQSRIGAVILRCGIPAPCLLPPRSLRPQEKLPALRQFLDKVDIVGVHNSSRPCKFDQLNMRRSAIQTRRRTGCYRGLA